MWGGRFQGELDPFFAQFQKSLTVDYALAFADLEVNRAWSSALSRASVLTPADVQAIHLAIDDLKAQWQQHGVPFDDPAEDVHSLVERELAVRCGDLAKRVHTGRSRNDQVATDLRLFLKELGAELLAALRSITTALVEKAERHFAAPIPGYTHLQRAQPITIGHWALAHAESLRRDRGRVQDALARLDSCPLGSGALAGTPVKVDRLALAKALGFASATHNSLDATASRDHCCELAFAAAMTMTNLSRLAEDCIIFASAEVRFGRFGDRVSTGSSLMPQKRNPDAMELVRGNTGLVHGALVALLSMLKGLPLAYNRDLQEDKAALLPALRRTIDCLRVAAIALNDFEFDTVRCAAEAERGYLNATDLADLLVAAGVSFRDAHELVGRAVNRAIEIGCELQALPPAEQKKLFPQLQIDLRQPLSAAAVLSRRDVLGGTAPQRVRDEVTRWQRELENWACNKETSR
ncbi:MAG: argininosuccinate lyase [Planctomycetota bacterium]|nr:argininosuccinate lyase [Planctomycetota bacterium]